MRVFSYPWWTHGHRYHLYRLWMRVSGRRVRLLERWVGELGDTIVRLRQELEEK